MRNFSISDFIANAKRDGLARQNRFWVKLGVVRRMHGEVGKLMANAGGRQELEVIHLFCKTVTVPGIQLASSAVRLTGEPIEVPYGRNFSPALMIFYVDKNLMVRQYFESWLNSIVDPETRELSYYKDYTTNIEVYVLSKEETSVYKITLFDAHPKGLGPLMLDNENNQLMLLDVNIDYRNYKTELITHVQSNGATIPVTDGIGRLKNTYDKKLITLNNDVVAFQSEMQNPFGDYAINYGALTPGILRELPVNPLFGGMGARVL